ncbi:hypothetical protein OG352_33475 [Streptomyces sp. NBC_01485]|uniref:hypothetical protein n=1 Tax=Streptomyces sp. NBC_01485 TaxID=2903884 RepID=UPI002E36D143|nr:hypothetical protein [Streptomyces sp. NBC_01485]
MYNSLAASLPSIGIATVTQVSPAFADVISKNTAFDGTAEGIHPTFLSNSTNNPASPRSTVMTMIWSAAGSGSVFIGFTGTAAWDVSVVARTWWATPRHRPARNCRARDTCSLVWAASSTATTSTG